MLKLTVLSSLLAFSVMAQTQDAGLKGPGADAALDAVKSKDQKQPGDELDVSKMPFNQVSVKAIMDANQPKIQGCYEERMADKEKVLQGKLVTSFVITGEGLVKKAEVEKAGTTLKDPELNKCVVAVLSSLTFPKPPNGKDVPITYPFNLKPVK